MISFNFKYLRPNSIMEAVEAYSQLAQEGKKVLYYNGGTEIVTFARKQVISVDAVIDIKGIEECRAFHQDGDKYVYGAALPLNQIIEDGGFPLFDSVLKTIADHTVRNRLSLGGNICGRLPYREALLPLLLTDAEFVIAGEGGIRTVNCSSVFDKRLKIKNEEFLVQVLVNKRYSDLDYCNIRRVKQGDVDYPILHVAMIRDKGLKAAFSGVCAFPFRSDEIDQILNSKFGKEEKISEVIKHLPSKIRDDQWASGGYRQMLLEKAIGEAISTLGGAII